MNNEPRYAIFLEDAQPVFDIDLERRVYEGMPQVAALLEKCREEGISLVASDQVPSQTIRALRANCNQIICFHLGEGHDIKEMQVSMGLSDEQAKVISQLKIGEAIVKKANYPYPFLMHTHNFKLPSISDKQITNIMSGITPSSLGIAPRLKLKDLLKPEELQITDEQKKPDALSPEKRAYAMDIYNRPLIPITMRDESLGLSAFKGNLIRSSLLKDGFARELKFGLPKQGFIKLLDLTTSGLEALGVLNE